MQGKVKTALVLIAGLTLSFPALAYIPKFWMIMSRTAENHGNGIYSIEQDVIFQHQAEPLVVHENWIVENEDTLRLQVTGKKALKDKINLTIVYNGKNKYFVDENGVRKTVRVSADWFEPFFYFRFSARIKPLMHSMQMIPTEGLEAAAKPRTLKEVRHDSENYVRLSRVQGKIAYGVGNPTPGGADYTNPGLWIEQDNFNILKLRLPSQVVVNADKYNKFPRDFWLPRQREISWGTQRARINVLNVTGLPTNSNVKSSLQPASLDFGKNPKIASQLPEDSVIREFYTRFR